MPNQDEIASQQELLLTHRRTLAHYLKQRAQLGDAYIPPVITHGIYTTRADIKRIKGILHEWNAPFDEHPDDTAPDDAAIILQGIGPTYVPSPNTPTADPQRNLPVAPGAPLKNGNDYTRSTPLWVTLFLPTGAWLGGMALSWYAVSIPIMPRTIGMVSIGAIGLITATWIGLSITGTTSLLQWSQVIRIALCCLFAGMLGGGFALLLEALTNIERGSWMWVGWSGFGAFIGWLLGIGEITLECIIARYRAHKHRHSLSRGVVENVLHE